MTETLELRDIQGIVARGYNHLTAATYLMLSIEQPARARAWLGTLAERVTTSGSRPGVSALNVALTRSGLATLGLPAETLALFSPQFLEGLSDPHRSRILGDVNESAPERWAWGGPSTPAVDLLIMHFAADQASVDAATATTSAGLEGAGLRLIQQLDTVNLGGFEQFGFHDGISQPTIEGLSRTDTAANTVKAGEFVLGYPNEYGYSGDPIPVGDPLGVLGSQRDLTRNGTYLVFRQLEQDVLGFWRTMRELAATAGSNEDEAEAAAVHLAARMVGRWPSGAPVVLSPEHDDPSLASMNDFQYYAHDPDGLACPIGAHVRRSNPRDALGPKPGTTQAVTASRHHRLLRRGREYGVPPTPDERRTGHPAPGSESVSRGLQFICLNADIARQFEFVQHAWINNGTFSGLVDDADPLVGPHEGSGATFTIQADPVACRFEGLPRFVSVRGGAYFFLPGQRALRYLATMPVA